MMSRTHIRALFLVLLIFSAPFILGVPELHLIALPVFLVWWVIRRKKMTAKRTASGKIQRQMVQNGFDEDPTAD